jgi:hypothetical protein
VRFKKKGKVSDTFLSLCLCRCQTLAAGFVNFVKVSFAYTKRPLTKLSKELSFPTEGITLNRAERDTLLFFQVALRLMRKDCTSPTAPPFGSSAAGGRASLSDRRGFFSLSCLQIFPRYLILSPHSLILFLRNCFLVVAVDWFSLKRFPYGKIKYCSDRRKRCHEQKKCKTCFGVHHVFYLETAL